MKTIYFLLFMFPMMILAQTPAATNPVEPAKTEFAAVTNAPKEAPKEGGEKKDLASLPSGYGDAVWGADYLTVKDKIRGKVVYAEENKIIISKEKEITYRYGFFYLDPEVVGDMPGAGSASRLFYSTIEFPYVAMADIRAKISEKYGEPTGENVKRNKGALYWDGEKTGIVMWVDEYEKKPFCRKIVYFSKDIVKELKDYKDRMFNRRELDVLKTIMP